MPVTKAVVPAAGLGTRFLPATKAIPKEMLPVIDKPTIQYIVEEAARAGLQEVVIVTARGKEAIEDHFARARELEDKLIASGKQHQADELRAITELADISYVIQDEPLGLGHAVSVARDLVGGEPFAVMLGDNVMHPTSKVLVDMVSAYEAHDTSVIALTPVDDVSLYGSAAIEPFDGDLVRVTAVNEKPSPEEAYSNLALYGRYVFSNALFDALADLKPGRGGEIQLTDAIGLLVDGPGVNGLIFEGGGYDMGSKLSHLEASIELALDREDLGPDLRAFLDGL